MKFTNETLPTEQIVFSDLKIRLFDSISVLRNEYIAGSQEMFSGLLNRIYQKLSKKTSEGGTVLKETKSVCTKITNIFTFLSDDEELCNKLFSTFTIALTEQLDKINELIVDAYVTPKNTWSVMNSIKKLLISLKTKDVQSDEQLDEDHDGKIIELDAVQRRIQNIIFNDLTKDLKTGISKLLKAYKVIESNPDSNYVKKSRIEHYQETSQQFLTTFFTVKISDFANNFREVFVERGNNEKGMFVKTSQELVVDCLHYFLMQYIQVDPKSLDLKQIISLDFKQFPNIFLPLFELSPN